jgi:hypothetical protein
MEPKEKAKQGVLGLEEAILELLAAHPEGLRNADIAQELDIRSDYKGGGKDYLSWSMLGRMMNAGKVVRKGRKYFRDLGPNPNL